MSYLIFPKTYWSHYHGKNLHCVRLLYASFLIYFIHVLGKGTIHNSQTANLAVAPLPSAFPTSSALLRLIQHGVYNAQLEWMWAGICRCQLRTEGAVAKDVLSVDSHLRSHFSVLSKNLLPGSLTNSSIYYTQSIYHRTHKKTVFANKSSNATVICSVFPSSWFPTSLLHRSTTVLKAT